MLDPAWMPAVLIGFGCITFLIFFLAFIHLRRGSDLEIKIAGMRLRIKRRK